MAKLLVIASLIVVNLLAIPTVFGTNLVKKELDRSSKTSFHNDDPPHLGW